FSKARKTGKVELIFITSCQVYIIILIYELSSQFPSIITIALNWNRHKTTDIYGENTEILRGEQAIDEAVVDYEFSQTPR
ncbi:23S rRNA (uracil-5-)-methyltransferase RumA, partial [Streptococcus suis]